MKEFLGRLKEKGLISSPKRVLSVLGYVGLGLVALFLLHTGIRYMRYGGKIPITVSSFSPTGEVTSRTNFTLEFSSDVIDKEKVNTILPPKDTPIRFSPEISGRFKWLSTKKLRFFTETDLQGATQWTVKVLPEVCTRKNRYLKGEKEFSFYTERLKILQSAPRFVYKRTQEIEARIEWNLEFNQPVSQDSLKENLLLYYDEKPGKKPISFTLYPNEPSKVIKLISDPIKRGKDEKSIKLRVEKGLRTTVGSLGLTDDFICELKVEPNLKVYEVYSQQNERECWIRIELSSPVDREIAKEHIKLEPSLDFRIEQDYRYLSLKGCFKPGEVYQVNIGEGLPGEDGTFLQKDFSTSVRIEDLAPSLSFKHKGIFLCRKGAMNIGIESVNIKRFNLKAEKIFANNLVYLLSNYGLDYWNTPYNLGKTVYEKEVTIEAEKNQIVITTLNLSELVNKRQGIFRVSIGVDSEDYWEHDVQHVMVTDIGLAAKLSQDDLLVWANSLKNLSALSGVQISIVSRDNQTLATGQTDENGILIIKDLKSKIEDFEPYIITASLGDDLSYLKFEDCRLPASSFDIGGRPYLTSGYEAYLYPDRGVFRPNDKANITSIIRGKGLSLAEEFPIKLQILDPTNRIFKEFNQKSKADMIEFSFEIPDYAKTGEYIAKLLVAETEIGRCDFSVEDFIPDRIKVSLVTDKASYSVGENMLIDVSGICLFGPPAAGRKVTAECQIKANPFFAQKFPGFTFGDIDKGFSEIRLDLGEDRCDDQGKHRFNLSIPKDIYPPASLKGIISTTVTEPGGRAVSGYTSVDIHPYPFYIGLKPLVEGYADIGKKYEVDYVVLNTKGEKVSPKVLSASFYRIVWQCILKKDNDGYYRYVSERSEQLIKSFNFSPEEVKRIGFVPNDYGEYKIVVSDPQNKAASSVRFYACGWGYAPWSMANPDRIEINTEKNSYPVGGIARVQIKAPFPGKMLLTIEREKVFSQRILVLKENTATIEIPVEEQYKPNVYITATIIRSIDSKDTHSPMRAFGITPLTVDCTAKKLSVEILSPKVIRPKNKLNLTINVKGGGGALLTVACVDEGILQLTDFQEPDPFNFFYGKKMLGVSSYDIYSFILPEVQGENKGKSSGDYIEKVRKKHLTPVSVKRVKPVSLWSGIIKLDSAGKARLSFDIPQFQGRLRIMAVVAKGSAFGSGRTDVTVRDPIVLTSTLPRFLAGGDKFTMPVSVFNGCGKAGEFTVSLKVSGPVEIIGEAKKRMSIPKNKEKETSFELRAKDGLGKVEFKLFAQGLGQTTEDVTELPIRPSVPAITKSGNLVVTPESGAEFELPGGWIDGTCEAKIIASSFPAVRFSGGLQYLLRYPHGCIEQTTSKVFPLLYFDELAKMAEPELFKKNSSGYYIGEGIAKLESMQLDSGAFSYWPGGGYVCEWGSIYASHFLVEAREAGYKVSDSVYKKMIGSLKEVVKRQADNNYNLEQQVYACYVLSLADEVPKGVIQYLKESRLKELSCYSQFQLAGCFGLSGDLKEAMSLLPTQIHPQTMERDTGGNFNSSIRANAIILDILAQLFPDNPGIPVLTKELVDSAKAGRWYTTQENAFAFLALGKVFKQQAEAKFTGELLVDGKIYKKFTQEKMTISDKRLAGKKLKARIQGKGNCYLYWQVYGVPKSNDVDESDKGIRVRRVFLDNTGKPISYQEMKQGELIVGKITMEALSKGLENVIVCDMLPAGLEIENPRLESRANIPWIADQGWQADYMDIRDDRLLLYTSLPRGEARTFYYGLRAVTVGEFSLPSIVAECMYDPTYISTAGSGQVKVLPMK